MCYELTLVGAFGHLDRKTHLALPQLRFLPIWHWDLPANKATRNTAAERVRDMATHETVLRGG